MKIVIQNGCDHALSRREVESMVPLFPGRWHSDVHSIVLYQGEDKEITTKYFEKEQILGLFSPKNFNSILAKQKAVEELLIGLEAIAKFGHLSKIHNKSTRQDLVDGTNDIREHCFELLKSNAT